MARIRGLSHRCGLVSLCVACACAFGASSCGGSVDVSSTTVATSARSDVRGGQSWPSGRFVAVSAGDATASPPFRRLGAVYVTLEGRRISWGANCNGFTGLVAVSGSRIHVSDVGSTSKMCGGARGREDGWLQELFEAGPRWRAVGPSLRFAAEGKMLRLSREPS